jgi:hypothetical protein
MVRAGSEKEQETIRQRIIELDVCINLSQGLEGEGYWDRHQQDLQGRFQTDCHQFIIRSVLVGSSIPVDYILSLSKRWFVPSIWPGAS